MKKRAIFAVLVVGGIMTGPARAGLFGGIDAGRTRDTNFTGAPSGAAKTAETMMTYSGYLGFYRPSADLRSAFVMRADAAATRFDNFNVFDNSLFGLSAGVFHAFSRANSMTFMVGANTRRFSDALRNTNAYNTQLGFKQKLGERFWLREGAGYEIGKAKARANEYRGYSAYGSFNWSPFRWTLVSLGASHTKRVYDVTVADRRTSDQASLGLVQQFGRYLYARASVARQRNSTNAGSAYETTVYSAGLGVGF